LPFKAAAAVFQSMEQRAILGVHLLEQQESHMKIALLGAAVLAAALAAPATAQEVIPNPGKCAQYYPNANCQNYGPGNPYRSYRSGWRSGYAQVGPRMWRHKHRHHRAY
jgi:hypothetical protein